MHAFLIAAVMFASQDGPTYKGEGIDYWVNRLGSDSPKVDDSILAVISLSKTGSSVLKQPLLDRLSRCLDYLKEADFDKKANAAKSVFLCCSALIRSKNVCPEALSAIRTISAIDRKSVEFSMLRDSCWRELALCGDSIDQAMLDSVRDFIYRGLGGFETPRLICEAMSKAPKAVADEFEKLLTKASNDSNGFTFNTSRDMLEIWHKLKKR